MRHLRYALDRDETSVKRIQRSRAKGFRLPPNTVCVDRSTKLGNPFNWRDGVEVANEGWAKGVAVDLLRDAIYHPDRYPDKKIPTPQQIREALKGKSFVACWCKTTEPCHGDLYIWIARGGC